MGTNFYLHTKSKTSVHKYFPDDYTFTEEPELAYEIHIAKISSGWKPLFQSHPHAFTTFAEFEKFYNESSGYLYEIYDEYNNHYTFKEFKDHMIDHASIPPEPYKWVYENNPIFNPDGRKTLDLQSCTPEEAEIYTPFDHALYQETYNKARKKFKVIPNFNINYNWDIPDPEYTSDPDYPFDWTDREFS